MFMKKSLCAVVAVVAAIASLAACGKSSGTIKIGVAGAHSGDLASYGLPTVQAAQLVVDEYNAKGGINGKKIELVIEDDQCKPEVATNTAAKLVSEGVVAVIGHICSGATKAALGIYKDSNILAISPSATNPPLTQSGDYPNFFRTIETDDAQADLVVKFVMEKLGAKKVAILHDKADYGKGFADFCKQFADAKGLEVVLFDGINPGAPDYSAVVNKIGNVKPDVVIWGGYHPEASKLVQQMRDKGINVPFISDDGVKADTFIDVAGKYAEGVYAAGPTDTSSNPIAVKAIADQKAKFGENSENFFLNAYAATQALCAAIEKAGSTKYEDISAALRGQFVETSLGKISFDEHGDIIGFGFSIYQVQSGKFVELK
jgi:branched-chain amino acid transport system substrate-binding protein